MRPLRGLTNVHALWIGASPYPILYAPYGGNAGAFYGSKPNTYRTDNENNGETQTTSPERAQHTSPG